MVLFLGIISVPADNSPLCDRQLPCCNGGRVYPPYLETTTGFPVFLPANYLVVIVSDAPSVLYIFMCSWVFANITASLYNFRPPYVHVYGFLYRWKILHGGVSTEKLYKNDRDSYVCAPWYARNEGKCLCQLQMKRVKQNIPNAKVWRLEWGVWCVQTYKS